MPWPSLVCKIPPTSPLVVDGTCKIGGAIVAGTSCDVQCKDGYVANGGSPIFSCGALGAMTSNADLQCIKYTTCGDPEIAVRV